jgi:hypothetical protein
MSAALLRGAASGPSSRRGANTRGAKVRTVSGGGGGGGAGSGEGAAGEGRAGAASTGSATGCIVRKREIYNKLMEICVKRG